MHFPHRLRAASALCAALAVLTVGCKKDKADEAAQQTSPGTVAGAPAPAPAATNQFRVENIELGRRIGSDRRIADRTNDFGVRDTIYVSVTTLGSNNGELTARFTYQDGQVVDSTSQQVAGAGVTAFFISKPTAWPKGDYRVEIFSNGVKADEKTFTVK